MSAISLGRFSKYLEYRKEKTSSLYHSPVIICSDLKFTPVRTPLVTGILACSCEGHQSFNAFVYFSVVRLVLVLYVQDELG